MSVFSFIVDICLTLFVCTVVIARIAFFAIRGNPVLSLDCHASKKRWLAMTELLPARCVLCGLPTHHTHNLCTPCLDSCRVYAYPYTHAYPSTFALFPYREPIVQMIRKLKFNQSLIYAKTLGILLATEAREQWYKEEPLPDRLIPVPLHPKRLGERGFNQALEIARHVAHELSLVVDYTSISRVKNTLAQSGLSKAERRNNIQGAFISHARFDGLSVAILDDVVTTGQTVAELSRVLEQSGAKRIDIWCCARA